MLLAVLVVLARTFPSLWLEELEIRPYKFFADVLRTVPRSLASQLPRTSEASSTDPDSAHVFRSP